MIQVCLKSILAARGLSQRELARRAGRHHDVISRFARNDTSSVSFELLSSVCRVLECQPGDLLRYSAAEDQPSLFGADSSTPNADPMVK